MSGFKPTRQANDVRPPVSGEVYAVATTAASVRYVIPTDWASIYVTWEADGDAVHLLFGDATVTADPTAVAGGAGVPITLTADADSTIKIADGSFMSMRVPSTATHFAVIGAAGGGFFRVWKSSN